MTHSITRLIPAALAMVASPLLADTTVIQAERVIVAPDAPPHKGRQVFLHVSRRAPDKGFHHQTGLGAT